MEIKQGYTLSQFIDYIDKNIEYSTDALQYIVNYNDIYKQPLHKGQFTPCDDEGNEIEKPREPMRYDEWKCGNGMADGIACVNYENELKKYQEAKKKVIFKNVESIGSQLVHNEFVLTDFVNGYHISTNQGIVRNIKTIGDLFEATNGQLETQNINI